GNIGLHAAAANNTVSVIEYFLDRCNVDINIVDEKGRSALHHACLKGCINSVFVLARRGIERWALDEAGHSAFEYLLGPGYMCLQCFDKFSANIDAVDSSGRSLLCLASWKGHKAIVASLLRRNSCLESEDMYKRTALYWAAQSGSLNIVKLLLEHGAKLT
ncbi:ankyrin repeat-containing domain protein, partial [Pyrenochaeta sp. MPI-SDFR-AT-0127]